MKKFKLILSDYVAIFIVIFTIIACMISSCTVKEVKYSNSSTEVKADTISIKLDDCGYFKRDLGIIKFNYDGHSYLYFCSLGLKDVMENIIHDPNCECLKKYNPIEKSIYDY